MEERSRTHPQARRLHRPLSTTAVPPPRGEKSSIHGFLSPGKAVCSVLSYIYIRSQSVSLNCQTPVGHNKCPDGRWVTARPHTSPGREALSCPQGCHKPLSFLWPSAVSSGPQGKREIRGGFTCGRTVSCTVPWSPVAAAAQQETSTKGSWAPSCAARIRKSSLPTHSQVSLGLAWPRHELAFYGPGGSGMTSQPACVTLCSDPRSFGKTKYNPSTVRLYTLTTVSSPPPNGLATN